MRSRNPWLRKAGAVVPRSAATLKAEAAQLRLETDDLAKRHLVKLQGVGTHYTDIYHTHRHHIIYIQKYIYIYK